MKNIWLLVRAHGRLPTSGPVRHEELVIPAQVRGHLASKSPAGTVAWCCLCGYELPATA
uniref:Uncharacterized protein n=1 Tax=Arundo donax TaxID=35708 RepID=A0A0A8ZXW5_ARUDO